jgi:hypothetical protein
VSLFTIIKTNGGGKNEEKSTNYYAFSENIVEKKDEGVWPSSMF